MEIIIKGEPEEIAALALAAQERRGDAGKPDAKKLVEEINRSILPAQTCARLVSIVRTNPDGLLTATEFLRSAPATSRNIGGST